MTFDETCRELGVSEAELEQLVAAGEIASIKEGDTLFFKADVVAMYRDSKDDDTILLADEEISLLGDDGLEEIDLLAMDDDEDSAPTTPVEKPVEASADLDISLDDSEDLLLDDDGLPEIDLDLDLDSDLVTDRADAETSADSLGEDADETLLSMDGLLEEEAETTTPIVDAGDDLLGDDLLGDDLLGDDLGDDTLLDTELDFGEETDTFDVDTVDDLTSDLNDEGAFLRGGGARVMQMKRKENNLWTTVVLALCAVVLLVPLAVTTNLIYYSHVGPESASIEAAGAERYKWVRDYNFFGGVVEGIADALKSR